MKMEVGRRRERKLKVAGKDGWPEKMKMEVGWLEKTKIPLTLVMCHAHDQVPLKLNG